MAVARTGICKTTFNMIFFATFSFLLPNYVFLYKIWFFDLFRFLWKIALKYVHFRELDNFLIFLRLCSNENKYVYQRGKWDQNSENGIFVDFTMFWKKNREKKIKGKLFFRPKHFNIFFSKTRKKYLNNLSVLGTLKLRAVQSAP